VKSIYLCGNLGPKVGMGHFYRLLAFAELCGADFQYFLAIPHAESIQKHLPSWLKTLEAPNIESLIKSITDPKNSLVVIDSYEATAHWFVQLNDAGIKSIYIDDLHSGFQANAIINHAPGAEKTSYSQDPKTVFVGSDYALIRKEFFERKRDKAVRENDTILICIGGADPEDLSFKIVTMLRSIRPSAHLNVILGGAYQGQLLHTRMPNLLCHHNLSSEQMITLIDATQLAIAPASTISMELCARRTAFACGYFVDNQKGIFKGLHKANVMQPLNDLRDIHETKLRSALDALADSQTIEVHLYNQQKLVDGRSAERIRDIANKTLTQWD
jgi:UDP-2,4-diacetamido-2,4,6-trideoxy-beta-L-altropyranose hydrolase